MKVRKSSDVFVGSGSVSDIIGNLRSCGIPEHARPVGMARSKRLTGDDFLSSETSFLNIEFIITFEWEDEE